ncbi:hypothetical protein V8F20_011221 [Naviculisporaceae sp. PSN 640]
MVTIDRLPPELLSEVLRFVAGPPPSETQLHDELHDEPYPRLLSSPERSLKNASLVCRRWRANALPLLFRHVVWRLDWWELQRVNPIQHPDEDPVDGLPLLAFLRDQELARYVDSLTLVVSDSLKGMVIGGSRADLILQTRPRARNIDARLIPQFGPPQPTALNQGCNWVWDMVFQLVNPLGFTILASPHVLARLLSVRIEPRYAVSLAPNTTQVLSLSRETKSRNDIKPTFAATGLSSSENETPRDMPNDPFTQMTGGVSSQILQGRSTKLFTMRPWTHLLLNEGSFTAAYDVPFEYVDRCPASILGALLGAEEKKLALVPDTLKSMAYVAVFPPELHFHQLVAYLPRLDRVFVQIVPRNNIPRGPQEGHWWAARNSCYRDLINHVTAEAGVDVAGHDGSAGQDNNWRHLEEFESGDAADKRAWDQAVREVCKSATGWRVEREGVLVREPLTQKPKEAGASPMSTTPDHSTENNRNPVDKLGALRRIAFNGTTRLPVPAIPYPRPLWAASGDDAMLWSLGYPYYSTTNGLGMDWDHRDPWEDDQVEANDDLDHMDSHYDADPWEDYQVEANGDLDHMDSHYDADFYADVNNVGLYSLLGHDGSAADFRS